MTIVEAKKKWGVAPAFNLEFVAYYEDREKRIKSLKKQINQDKKDFQDLRNQESELTLKLDTLNKLLSDSSESNAKTRRQVELCRNLLSLGGGQVPKPVPKVALTKIGPSQESGASVSIRAKSTAYSSALSSQVCGTFIA